MRIVVAIIFALVAASGGSSTRPLPLWDPEWRLIVADGRCLMLREYRGSPGIDVDSSGATDELEVGGFQIQFVVYSDLKNDQEQHYEPGRPYLTLIGGIKPMSRQEQLRIEEARIGSSKFEFLGQRGMVYMFYLDADESKMVFDALSDDKLTDLVLKLANGKTINLRIPGEHAGRFNIQARMLEVCAGENVI